MRREAIKQLYAWKQSADRKPLIIRGARQVGKTWLMKEFGAEAYKKMAYINFEDNDLVKHIFEQDFDINRILLALQSATGVVVDTETLIVFDEIQEAPRALTSLKYFQEKAPQYQVMAAGSLLGIAIGKGTSFPVGKVNFVDIFPLSFIEFAEALGHNNLIDLLKQPDWGLIDLFRPKFEEVLRQYYYVGGMPAVVLNFVQHGNLAEVRQLQLDILDAYDRDFSKHAPINEVPRIRLVWKSIAAQLAKENRKFIYGQIREGARAKDFEIAIEWLRDSGLIYKVQRAKKAQMPLLAYEDFAAFKMFMLDVGLMCAMSNLPVQALLGGSMLFIEYKGALTEQYVLQQLKTITEVSIYYWSAENSRGEIDFLLQYGTMIIPVEVKAEENLQSKSLRAYVEKNPQLHGVRFSMSPYREQDWITNYPLYAISRLIEK